MARMRCAMLVAPRRVEVGEAEKPEADADTVIVRMSGLGICGSNLHWWHGGGAATGIMRFPMPGAGGHEYAGVVEEVGANITRVKLGDRVAIDQFESTSCGGCEYCNSGLWAQCARRRVYGQTGFVEFLKLGERGLHILPPNIETHAAVVAEPAAAPVSGLRRAQLRGGETVAVLGSGVLGLAAVGAAKALGAERVISTAKYPHQAALAPKFGADTVVSSAGEGVVPGVLAAAGGRGADVVVETVGGHAPTLQQAMDIVRPGGKIVVLGLWDELVPVDSWKAVLKDITFMFCLTYGLHGRKSDYGLTVDWMGSGKLPVQELVTHVLPFDRIDEAFHLAADKTQGVMKVVVTP